MKENYPSSTPVMNEHESTPSIFDEAFRLADNIQGIPEERFMEQTYMIRRLCKHPSKDDTCSSTPSIFDEPVGSMTIPKGCIEEACCRLQLPVAAAVAAAACCACCCFGLSLPAAAWRRVQLSAACCCLLYAAA